MDTVSINRILAGVKEFRGTWPADAPVKPAHPAGYIFNTHEASKPGEHWVALWVDARRRGEYFDPYGIPPLTRTLERQVIRLCESYSVNKCPIQSLSMGSQACGPHCIVFVALKSLGYSMEQICGLFNRNREINDIVSEMTIYFAKNFI